MTIPAVVSLDALRGELPEVVAFAAAVGVVLDTSNVSEDDLRMRVTFRNADGESFYCELDCRDFPLYPPTVEFLDETWTRRGEAGLYPAGFHPTPCVCARYNRKAYADVGGPHGDWRLVDWRLPTPNGGPIDSLAMIVSDLHAKISRSTGRLG